MLEGEKKSQFQALLPLPFKFNLCLWSYRNTEIGTFPYPKQLLFAKILLPISKSVYSRLNQPLLLQRAVLPLKTDWSKTNTKTFIHSLSPEMFSSRAETLAFKESELVLKKTEHNPLLSSGATTQSMAFILKKKEKEIKNNLLKTGVVEARKKGNFFSGNFRHTIKTSEKYKCEIFRPLFSLRYQCS